MNEWRELKTLQEVAEAQKNGEEIEVDTERRGRYLAWSYTGWDSDWNFRSRPEKKTKTVVLREGLYQSLTGGYWTCWSSEVGNVGLEKFIKWLDTPERIVEITE